ncbi:hypothetical protein EHZ47_21600 [Aeromonas jandaei]|uniref:hypothetical protein n=1 Tax=Aeromonas jandaei TaxID=650 RepID=UPI000F5226D8|nr:hypothetical protein [Aeromonas jandaei]RQM70659.1 hypothetical protein EHZ47_21600 [Aeromonas jandaei]
MNQRSVASVSVDAEYYPLRGEIDLFRVKLPQAPSELTIKVKGQRSGKHYDFNLGTWSLLLHAKAWGKAGAMMAAGREISLSHTLGGVSLSGKDWVSKAGQKGKFEGEVGIEVGASVSGALQWRPTALTCQQFAIEDEARLPLTLCKATTGLKASLKKSFESPIVLSWRGKWLRLGIRAGCFGGAASANAYLEFELDWQGRAMWWPCSSSCYATASMSGSTSLPMTKAISASRGPASWRWCWGWSSVRWWPPARSLSTGSMASSTRVPMPG